MLNDLKLGARLREIVPRTEEGYSNENYEVDKKLFFKNLFFIKKKQLKHNRLFIILFTLIHFWKFFKCFLFFF